MTEETEPVIINLVAAERAAVDAAGFGTRQAA